MCVLSGYRCVRHNIENVYVNRIEKLHLVVGIFCVISSYGNIFTVLETHNVLSHII